jgi:hypothetical protein
MTPVTRKIKVVLCLAIVFLAANAIRLTLAPKVQARSASTAFPDGVAIVPYTVAMTESVVSADGRMILAPSQTIAVRSDGARVMKIGDSLRGTRIIQFPSGLNVEVSAAWRAKSTMQRPQNDYSWILDPKSSCMKAISGQVVHEGQAAVEDFRGHRAVRVQIDNRIRWFALDLGCAPLGGFTDSGTQGTSTLELVSLIPGEPTQSLFDIPAGYREVPPLRP